MEYLFFVVCLTAAVTDLFWRRIPNIWLGSWFLTGLLLTGAGMIPLQAAAFGTGPFSREIWRWQAEIAYLGRGAAACLFLYPACRLRMIGAGDVKLGGITAAFLGLDAFVCCMAYSLFLGSILSFFYMVFTKSLKKRICVFLAWFGQCVSCGRWVPYRKEKDREGTIPFAPVFLAGYLLFWKLT